MIKQELTDEECIKLLKHKVKKRTLFSITSVINLMWYTIVVLIANFHDHTVQPELTIAWFSAWTIELALLFGIKVLSKSSNDQVNAMLAKCMCDKLSHPKTNDSDDCISKVPQSNTVG